MNWIKVTTRNDIPMDGNPFLAMWKGRIVLAQYDTEDNIFWICWEPADSSYMPVHLDRENKFRFWMPLPKEKHELD